MIPQEKIRMAMEANDYSTNGDECAAYDDDFTAGVRFAESELQEIAETLVELAMRTKVAFPTNEEQDRMFTEGLKEQTGFQERLFAALEKINNQ